MLTDMSLVVETFAGGQQVFQILERRREELRPVAQRLAACDEQRELSPSRMLLANSYDHMHCNRLCGLDRSVTTIFMLDATTDHHSRRWITGERREKETFMRRSVEGSWKRAGYLSYCMPGSERGGWKRTRKKGNAPATYSTASSSSQAPQTPIVWACRV